MAKKKDYISQTELAEYRDANVLTPCPILGHSDFIPVVDHDHKTGRIRGVVSNEGNALLGKIENFHGTRCAKGIYDLPTVLRELANYLEQDQGPLHPVGTRQLTKRFGRMRQVEQYELLILAGADDEEIEACKNSQQRTKLYRRKLVND